MGNVINMTGGAWYPDGDKDKYPSHYEYVPSKKIITNSYFYQELAKILENKFYTPGNISLTPQGILESFKNLQIPKLIDISVLTYQDHPLIDDMLVGGKNFSFNINDFKGVMKFNIPQTPEEWIIKGPIYNSFLQLPFGHPDFNYEQDHDKITFFNVSPMTPIIMVNDPKFIYQIDSVQFYFPFEINSYNTIADYYFKNATRSFRYFNLDININYLNYFYQTGLKHSFSIHQISGPSGFQLLKEASIFENSSSIAFETEPQQFINQEIVEPPNSISLTRELLSLQRTTLVLDHNYTLPIKVIIEPENVFFDTRPVPQGYEYSFKKRYTLYLDFSGIPTDFYETYLRGYKYEL